MATTVFCPPESCDIVDRAAPSPPEKETSMRTPPGASPSSSSPSACWTIRSRATPPRTRSAKTALKCLSTWSKVRCRISSFCSSKLLMKPSIASMESSCCFWFRSRSSSWVLKVANWSMAFLLTCSNFCSAFDTCPKAFMSCGPSMSLNFARSPDTAVMFRIFSSASFFLFAKALMRMTSSSRAAVSLAIFACNCWSCSISLTRSSRFASSAVSASWPCSVAVFSSASTAASSACRRSTTWLRSLSNSSWSAPRPRKFSASSSRSRGRK
mmetsp:Transcript_99056/g.284617  ORF Transcript_99056/g.284617 Transcript_99056/m.284617 type:complete len:269 (-) Transcript_99056:1468-2274(-)